MVHTRLSLPLTQVLQKDKPFRWHITAEFALDAPKTTFTSAPICVHAYLSKTFVIEIVVSDYALGAILS